MTPPLMPKATAVWLIDNTALTFEQIGEFCGLHSLEIQGIADGEVAIGIVGRDPIVHGELTQQEITRCEKDRTENLDTGKDEIEVSRRNPGPRYTPLSKRQNRPDAIAWLAKYHPELSDAQICRLVGTTKPTVVSVRKRTHWNMPNLKPSDPVTLGMCSQSDLDQEITKALRRKVNKEKREKKAAAKARKEKNAIIQKNIDEISETTLLDQTIEKEPQEGSTEIYEGVPESSAFQKIFNSEDNKTEPTSSNQSLSTEEPFDNTKPDKKIDE